MSGETAIANRVKRRARLVALALGLAVAGGILVAPSAATAQEWRFGFHFGGGDFHRWRRPPPRFDDDDGGFRFRPFWRPRPPPVYYGPPQMVVMPQQYPPPPPPQMIEAPAPEDTGLTAPASPAPPASGLPASVSLAQLP